MELVRERQTDVCLLFFVTNRSPDKREQFVKMDANICSPKRSWSCDTPGCVEELAGVRV